MATAREKREQEEKEAPQAAREAVKETEPVEEAETYSIEWLVGAAPSYGQKPEDVAGALSAQSRKNLTIEEAEAATKAWLEAPVKTEA
jgi:hypothetical protein